jgi:UDP-4-amino-4,6-dideoxy-N-acetyl-beta-L-altrosamine transaminase
MPIPYTRHQVTESDITALEEVLRGAALTQGPQIELFERKIADYVGSKYAIAVNSGTAALHVAYLALGVGPSSTVWTTPITFVATANAARLCGARVEFIDIDPDTFNLCLDRLEEKLGSVLAAGEKTPDLVVPVHFAGMPLDMPRLERLAAEYKFAVVEDAAHALGAETPLGMVGGCQASAITTFSTHPAKLITTGEGGVCTTNSQELAKKMRAYRSHGIHRQLFSDGRPWEYQQHQLGLNYRLPDVNAALGSSQMGRIERLLEERAMIAARYREHLSHEKIKFQKESHGVKSANHLCTVRFQGGKRDEVYHKLREAGVHAQVHYIPVHTQPYYQQIYGPVTSLTEAEKYYSEALSLPLYPGLKPEEQSLVIDVVKKALG